MRKTLITALVLIFSIALAAACSSKPAAPMPAPPAAPPAQAAVASNIANFSLQNLTVRVGTTVKWTNTDTTSHTTTSGTPPNKSGQWDSPPLRQSEAFSFTFSQAGAFPYFCRIHNDMTATVTVQ